MRKNIQNSCEVSLDRKGSINVKEIHNNTEENKVELVTQGIKLSLRLANWILIYLRSSVFYLQFK